MWIMWYTKSSEERVTCMKFGKTEFWTMTSISFWPTAKQSSKMCSSILKTTTRWPTSTKRLRFWVHWTLTWATKTWCWSRCRVAKTRWPTWRSKTTSCSSRLNSWSSSFASAARWTWVRPTGRALRSTQTNSTPSPPTRSANSPTRNSATTRSWSSSSSFSSVCLPAKSVNSYMR